MKLTKAGYNILRARFGRLTQSQVDEIEYRVSVMDQDKSLSYAQAAYILATIWHETDTKMQPIEEYGKGKGRPYGTWLINSKGVKYCYKNGRKDTVYTFDEYPHLYYGRGDAQNTWFDNYEKLSKVFGIDFLNHPELLLQREYSVKVIIYSMKVGLYTGKKLSDYIYQSKIDFVNARGIVNGTDRAKRIARYAEVFYKALKAL